MGAFDWLLDWRTRRAAVRLEREKARARRVFQEFEQREKERELARQLEAKDRRARRRAERQARRGL